MFEFFQQVFVKIAAILASLFIAIGIVKMPQTIDYDSLRIKLPVNLPQKEIIQETAEPQSEQSQPKQPQLPPKAPVHPSGEDQSLAEKIIPPSIPSISLTELNKKSREAIVNIFCVPKGSGVLKSTTGSGVIISNGGIILTTAHLAQYFLLEDYPNPDSLNCVIRNGDIASNAYDAKLLYLPSRWIEKNIASITQEEARGTGEDDYALLLISEPLTQEKELPMAFPFIEPNFNFENLPDNMSVLLASYPAGFLGGPAIQKDLGLVSTFALIKKLFTFSEEEQKYLDLFSLGGNVASQGGSSGGAAIDIRDGKLIGLIVTSTAGTTTSARELNAITIPHISRSFQQYTSQNLREFLSSPESLPNIFPEAEFNRLKNLLIEQLNKY